MKAYEVGAPGTHALECAARCEREAPQFRAMAYRWRDNPILGRGYAEMAESLLKEAELWFQVAMRREEGLDAHDLLCYIYALK